MEGGSTGHALAFVERTVRLKTRTRTATNPIFSWVPIGESSETTCSAFVFGPPFMSRIGVVGSLPECGHAAGSPYFQLKTVLCGGIVS